MQSHRSSASLVTFVALCFSVFSSTAVAEVINSSHGPLKLETHRNDLHHPWGMTFLNQNEVLVTERRGRLWRLNLQQGTKREVTGLPVIQAKGQGGLLDVELSPDFQQNRRVYLSFTGGSKDRKSTHVGFGILRGNRLANFKTVFKARPFIPTGYHFGSRLVFDNKGHLFISLGDRGKMALAQDTSNHAGTMIRIFADGGIPKTNPFIGKSAYQPEIYSYGHRNIQGAALNPWTNELWTHEHGPRGGDELNIIRSGRNYGWPKVTYGINYDGSEISAFTSMTGLTPPIHHWTPSIAPSGMTFVYGPEFPQWEGNLLIGSLKFRQLRNLKVKGARVLNEEILLDQLDERIRDVEIGPGGLIYLLTDSKAGRLMSLRLKSSAQPKPQP